MHFPQALLFSLGIFLSAVPVYAGIEDSRSRRETAVSQEKITALPASGIPKTWLQGSPVTEWEKDKVYIFEFWATWCGPCLAAIPHLETIHKEIVRDNLPAQLIGVNIRDRATPERLKNFLAKRPMPPTYAIAVDSDQNTEKEWLRPMKVIGIPFAVAVKNGEILWRGHPVKLSAKLVREMLRENYSFTPIRSREEILADAKKRIAEISELFNGGEIDAAETALQSFTDDESVPVAQKIEALEIPVSRALKNGEYRKANAGLRRIAEMFPQSFHCQIRVADFIRTTEDVPANDRDLALALECLDRALSLCGDMPAQESFVYTRISEIHAERGDNENALDAARKAWERAPEYAYLETLRQKLSREPENREAFELLKKIEAGEIPVPEDFLYGENVAGTPDENATTNPEMLKNFLKTSNALSEVNTLVRQMKFVEARERIEAMREDINRHPQLDMRAAELLVGEPFAQKDFKRVGEICEAMLNKYPKLGYIAEYQMKILTSSEELRAQNLPVLVHACKNVITAGTPYKAAYLRMLAGFYEEMGEAANAVRAAFAAREFSEKYRDFKTAEARCRSAKN